MRKLIHLVAGARPNFMKIAPLYHQLERDRHWKPEIVHTGQHSDLKMSGVFFEDLGLPLPHIQLKLVSDTQIGQLAEIMCAYEKVCLDRRPDVVVVVGDVTSTLASGLVASKLGIKLVHLEAGLRSFDRLMPEETNRRIVDSISDLLLTPSLDGNVNLLREGIAKKRIRLVGNIMIDSLVQHLPEIEKSQIISDLKLNGGEYMVLTCHRPANVDNKQSLIKMIEMIDNLTDVCPVVFPIHPRTLNSLKKYGLLAKLKRITGLVILDPIRYVDFMSLVKNSRLVVTDSGGVQEETTYLKIPCLTIRENTERPETIKNGTNRLIKIEDAANQAARAFSKRLIARKKPRYWDGKTAQRVVKEINRFFK